MKVAHLTILLVTFPVGPIAFERVAVAYQPCPYELSDRIDAGQSPWKILVEVSTCNAADAGWTKVLIRNSETGEEQSVIIVKNGTVGNVTYRSPSTVAVQLPNLSYIVSSNDTAGPFSIVYKFQPEDDDIERQHYRDWVDDPNDPKSIAWAKKALFSQMYSGSRSSKP